MRQVPIVHGGGVGRMAVSGWRLVDVRIEMGVRLTDLGSREDTDI